MTTHHLERDDRSTEPRYLAGTGWLEAHLADPALRVFDCTVFLRPTPDDPLRVESGHDAWIAGHVPGSGFLDLIGELSDPASSKRYALPSAERFAASMSRHGVGEGTRVVLYSAESVIWATRVWWLLRVFGFDAALVLDGGFDRWRVEGRPLSTAPCAYPPATFVPRPRPGLVAGRADVLAALAEGHRVVNALTAAQHAGGGVHYGRPGRIAGSVNVPAHRLVDRETRTFLPLGELARAFEAAGVAPAGRLVTYCGAGIAATADAFVLARLGRDDVAVYDGSLWEWCRDPTLPMETG